MVSQVERKQKLKEWKTKMKIHDSELEEDDI